MALRPIHTLSLCTGGAGLEEGIQDATSRACRVVAYVEREATALEILLARIEEGALDAAPVWDDLRTFDARPFRGVVDLVTAGYPCQPESTAGKRRGADDERWIWTDIVRVLGDAEPALAFFENVAAHISGTFERVLRDLAALGFDVEWDCVPAAAVGAPHLRDRVFILATHADRAALWLQPERREWLGRRARAAERRDAVSVDASEGWPSADADGLGSSGRPAGGLVAPEPEAGEGTQGHPGQPPADPDMRRRQGERLSAPLGEVPPGDVLDRRHHPRDAPPNPDGTGLESGRRSEGPEERPHPRGRGGGWAGRPPPEPTVRGVDDGLARQLDSHLVGAHAGRFLRSVERDRLFVCGNGVVPQQAARAWHTLWRRRLAR